jgi:hypothetical protein
MWCLVELGRIGRALSSSLQGRQSARKRTSLATGFGLSGVGCALEAAIEIAGMKVASSAIADIGAGQVVRQQCGAMLTMAASSNPTAAFLHQ